MELVKYNGNLKSELFRFTTECFAELGKSFEPYGRQILLWALENINSKRIILRVAAWNKRAISLYEKNGFEIVGKA